MENAFLYSPDEVVQSFKVDVKTGLTSAQVKENTQKYGANAIPEEDVVTRLAYIALFQTGWFVESMWTQTFVIHMIRTPKIPFIQSRPSAPLMMMTLLIMAVGIFIPMGPLAHYFKLQALPMSYFGILALILLGYMLLTQAMKAFYTRRFGWQ